MSMYRSRHPRIRAIAAIVFTTLVAAGMAIVGTGTATAASGGCAGFSDVSTANSHCDDITWFVNTGTTNGYADGTFRAGKAVSRGTMAAFFYRLAHDGDHASACSSDPFPDVPADSALCGAIAWLSTSGVTSGYPDGTFRPSDAVTRGAMAAFLYRFAGPSKKARACAAPLFDDVAPGDNFCAEIGWMAYHGVAHGLAQSTEYRPGKAISRATMATFVHRVATSSDLGARPRAYAAFDAVFVDLVNHARASRDLPTLRPARSVATVAEYWANQMADGATGGDLQHNPDFFEMLRKANPATTAGAENVARFTAAHFAPQQIMTAYMKSPGHRANILSPKYHYIGLRTEASSIAAFNTMNFVDRVG